MIRAYWIAIGLILACGGVILSLEGEAMAAAQPAVSVPSRIETQPAVAHSPARPPQRDPIWI